MKRLVLASLWCARRGDDDGVGERRGHAAPARRCRPRRRCMRAPYNWTGFYVGINGGGGWGRSDWSNPFGTGSMSITSGGLVGGTLGYNYQMGQVVFGLEGDIDWSNIRGSTGTLRRHSCETRNNLARHRARPPRLCLRPLHALCHRRRAPSATSRRRSPASAARPPPRPAGRSAAASKSPSPDRGPPRSNISMSISARAAAVSRLRRPTDVSFTSNIVRAGINYRSDRHERDRTKQSPGARSGAFALCAAACDQAG